MVFFSPLSDVIAASTSFASWPHLASRRHSTTCRQVGFLCFFHSMRNSLQHFSGSAFDFSLIIVSFVPISSKSAAMHTSCQCGTSFGTRSWYSCRSEGCLSERSNLVTLLNTYSDLLSSTLTRRVSGRLKVSSRSRTQKKLMYFGVCCAHSCYSQAWPRGVVRPRLITPIRYHAARSILCWGG